MKKNILVSLVLLMISMNISAQGLVVNKTLDTVFVEKNIKEANFQIGFITPLGTNGRESLSTINNVSLNILGGCSYGNIGVEFGGLYNVNTEFTKGVQFAGVSNFTGNSLGAAQFAGMANIATSGVVSVQYSAAVNVAEGVKGAQFGGLVNVAEGVKGAQFGGLINAAEGVKGAQFGGLINAAEGVKGAQFGGLVNVAEEVKGAQFGGLVNVVKKLNGVQIGLINYAEESDGLSIGLINIVKNGGKREFEISVSDAINTAVSFRLGTNRLYTIFSVGINYLSISTPSLEYAVGMGLGTHCNWRNGWGSQIELVTHTLTEGGRITHDINMLNQLKFIISKEFAKNFKIFAGPVLNQTVSNYINPLTGELGASLAPWSMWKNTSNQIRLNSWIGFTAGIRF